MLPTKKSQYLLGQPTDISCTLEALKEINENPNEF